MPIINAFPDGGGGGGMSPTPVAITKFSGFKSTQATSVYHLVIDISYLEDGGFHLRKPTAPSTSSSTFSTIGAVGLRR